MIIKGIYHPKDFPAFSWCLVHGKSVEIWRSSSSNRRSNEPMWRRCLLLLISGFWGDWKNANTRKHRIEWDRLADQNLNTVQKSSTSIENSNKVSMDTQNIKIQTPNKNLENFTIFSLFFVFQKNSRSLVWKTHAFKPPRYCNPSACRRWSWPYVIRMKAKNPPQRWCWVWDANIDQRFGWNFWDDLPPRCTSNLSKCLIRLKIANFDRMFGFWKKIDFFFVVFSWILFSWAIFHKAQSVETWKCNVRMDKGRFGPILETWLFSGEPSLKVREVGH